MTRINVFKASSSFSWFFLVFGSVFLVLGAILFIRALIEGFEWQFFSGDWNSVIYMIQGILFMAMGLSNLLNRKYFIEWDDSEIRFLLPRSKQVEMVRISELSEVEIRLFEIRITLPDKTRVLDLNNLQFEDLRKIKEKFETIRNRVNVG